MMSLETLAFYLLSAIILIAGLLAVTSKKIFRSAIWLLFALMATAGLFLWMQNEFLAAIQVIVYVGGIVVLIIFSIFLTQQTGANLPGPRPIRVALAILASLFGLGLTAELIHQNGFESRPGQNWSMNLHDLGSQLLSVTGSGYALPLEIISVFLLAALIGCIVIAMKSKPVK